MDGGNERERPPLPKGDHDENPRDIALPRLLLEDFRTHDSSVLEPGFWAIAVHRFGNWRMNFPKPLRAPMTALYHTLHKSVTLCFGIDLGYTTKLGRRVRLWHHGGMVLGARAIGNDVHIRQNTTFGIASRDDLTAKPVIGDRVDVGAGACVLGDVVVGDDAVIGANSVVVKDVAPHSVMFGVPARPVQMTK
jgi:serine O-acetyltransferase